jgi:hypothetical protein
MELHPGANDIGALSSGVYFVLEPHAQTVRKFVVQR